LKLIHIQFAFIKRYHSVHMLFVEKCVPLFWFVSGSWKYLNQYIGASLLVLAAGFFGSFCATCNKVAHSIILFGESEVPYLFSTSIDKSL